MDINQRIKAIQETRGRVWNEAQGFLADLEGVEMNAEQRTQWERYNVRLDELQADGEELIKRAETEQERAQVREAQSIAFGAEPDDETERRNLNADLRDWIRGEKRMSTHDFESGRPVNAISANLRGVQRERDLLRMGATPEEVRALAWDTGSVASAVPTLFDRTLYEVMEESIAAFKMPLRRMSTDSGAPMDVPKVTAHAIATQVAGQGTTLAGTDPTFGKTTLTPVKYGELITIASEVVSDTGVDIVSWVARDIGRAVGRRLDTADMAKITAAAFTGAAGTMATGGSLVGPTFSNLVSTEFSVNDEYRSSQAAGWLFRDATAGVIRSLRDGAGGTEGAPLWQPNLTGGLSGFNRPSTLFGYPVFTDPNIASMATNAKIAFFGDWSSFYFRTVGELMVERNDSVGFTTDTVAFRGKWRGDAAAADLTAINFMAQRIA